ncbi:MAG: SMP-30/gluconolactonase/LRE family protein, partial [Candidatus Acidiferrales bacterium]
MKQFRTSLAVLLAFAMSAAFGRAQTAPGSSIVRLDPALDELVSPDAKLSLVKGGFGFTEGPTWVQHGKTGYLLFSDMPANVIFKMTLEDGKVS